MLSQSFLDDLWNKSQNGLSWTNQGDGSFSDGNGETVQDEGTDQEDPKKKGQSDLPYFSDLHKRANKFSYDKALGPRKDGDLWEYLNM